MTRGPMHVAPQQNDEPSLFMLVATQDEGGTLRVTQCCSEQGDAFDRAAAWLALWPDGFVYVVEAIAMCSRPPVRSVEYWGRLFSTPPPGRQTSETPSETPSRPSLSVRQWFRQQRAADFQRDTANVRFPMHGTLQAWNLFDTQRVVERVTKPTYAVAIDWANLDAGTLYRLMSESREDLMHGSWDAEYGTIGAIERATEPTWKPLTDVHGLLAGDDESPRTYREHYFGISRTAWPTPTPVVPDQGGPRWACARCSRAANRLHGDPITHPEGQPCPNGPYARSAR